METSTYFTACVLVAQGLLLSSPASNLNSSCTTGFYFNTTERKCLCDRYLMKHGSLVCDQENQKAYIPSGVCVISGGNTSSYYVGASPLVLGNYENSTNRMLSELPSDPDLLNITMCGVYKRKAFLCGKCKDGHSFSTYLSDLKCINCSKAYTSIYLFLFVEIAPITLMFVFVVALHLKVTSGPLLGYILFCQAYYAEIVGRNRFVFDYIYIRGPNVLKEMFKISRAISEFWTTGFFRSAMPPVCISEKLSSAEVQLLTLIPSTYVVILVIAVCIIMHLKNYKIIQVACKPLDFIFLKFKAARSICNSFSIINAFATFLFMSSTSIMYNVAVLSFSSSVYDEHGKFVRKVVLIDPTLHYFHNYHFLYLLIAMVPFIFLVVIPSLLLCAYPTNLYHRFSLKLLSARKRLYITAFTEALNNCFKDGLNGTRDYRHLAGLIILTLPIGYIIVSFIRMIAKTSGITNSSIGGYMVFALAVFVAYVRPFKLRMPNISMIYHFFVFGIILFGINSWHDFSVGTDALMLTLIIIPFVSHLFVLLWLLYTIYQNLRHCCGQSSVFNMKRMGYDEL